MCVIAQESAESKYSSGSGSNGGVSNGSNGTTSAQLPNLDLCSGEDMHTIALQCQQNDLTLSRTSRTILYINFSVAVMITISILRSSKPANIVILLLVFLQPLIILYFVYWKDRRISVKLDR